MCAQLRVTALAYTGKIPTLGSELGIILEPDGQEWCVRKVLSGGPAAATMSVKEGPSYFILHPCTVRP